ncbi:hypothetical protein [Methanoculleus sp. UBA430]|uniref:hypothetical protein n=1 Tax=Methanoculleus sp. UBA430 TaxID=1915511 RepID=UPI0025D1302A|nr:hypothetical protein [Methanoculleus sp. UBA430]
MISEIFSLRHDETRRGVAGSTTINLRTHHLLSRQTIRETDASSHPDRQHIAATCNPLWV